jgi:hypothetical protein
MFGDFESRKELGIFLLFTASKPTLSPTLPPIQWLPGALSLGVKCRCVKLTTRLHLATSSKMYGTIISLPHWVFMAWCSVEAQGQLSLYSYWFVSFTNFGKTVKESVLEGNTLNIHQYSLQHPSEFIIHNLHVISHWRLCNMCSWYAVIK